MEWMVDASLFPECGWMVPVWIQAAGATDLGWASLLATVMEKRFDIGQLLKEMNELVIQNKMEVWAIM